MLTPHPTPYTLREKREELYITGKMECTEKFLLHQVTKNTKRPKSRHGRSAEKTAQNSQQEGARIKGKSF